MQSAPSSINQDENPNGTYVPFFSFQRGACLRTNASHINQPRGNKVSRINGHINLTRPQMAYVVVIASLLFLTAIDAHADQYSCSANRKGYARPYYVVEAASKSEAIYKLREQHPSLTNMGSSCINVSAEVRVNKSDDIFVRDERLRSQGLLRPYLPTDLKRTSKPQFTCDATGGFLPDGSLDRGVCFELSSPSTRATYKVRIFSPGHADGLTSQVWKRDGGGWKQWVEFHQTNHQINLKSASADAKKYAAAHGAAQRKAPTATQPDVTNPTDTAASPQSAESQLEDVVKKGIGNLFKGFGQ